MHPMATPIQIFACQNRTCRRDGSTQVLETLKQEIATQGLTEQVAIQETGCLGQCGNGPMLMVLQSVARQEIWYDRMQAREVPLLVKQHLLEGKPVADLLSRTKHPKRDFPTWTQPLPPPWHT
jgi:(2Fe-2S) ferredoxin